ncbi:MAG: energy-coupling factor transporter transmembrane protein EcfT [Clostridia bacterium]|nr:energy-coupling factor transporter transmembrane protein EcfT [Clostridia bacterium]
MLSDVTFGQYYPASSFVHKMDARVKLLLLIAYIVLIFVVKNFYGFLLATLFFLLATFFSKVPLLEVLKSVKAIILIVLITVILNLFFYQVENPTVLLEWGFIVITKEALIFSAFMALRLILLVLGSSILSLTTTPVALTDGIESLLSPLKVIKFPVHELALIMSIALRFIPILMSETDRIIMAQKARGADFDSGNIFKRATAMIPVLIPLLISAFRRADELGDAMDARCYSGSTNRTKFKKLTLTWRDLVATIVTVTIITGVILLNTFMGVII